MFGQLQTWFDSPYSDNMSAIRWFLFVGFLLIVGVVWSVIIKHLTD